MRSDSESESSSAETPPEKKTKYLCVYLKKCEEQYSYLKFVPSNVYRAYCIKSVSLKNKNSRPV
jgi:hypothetical protein